MLTAVAVAVAMIALAVVGLIAVGVRRGGKRLARILAPDRLDEAVQQAEQNRSDEKGAA